MATAAEAARVEVVKALEDMALTHEGLRDLSKLVTNDVAQRAVKDAIDDYDRRKDLLDKFRAAADALISDGHPNLDVREIMDAAYKDIKAQNDSVAAALEKFRSDQARSLGLVAETPTPKPTTPA